MSIYITQVITISPYNFGLDGMSAMVRHNIVVKNADRTSGLDLYEFKEATYSKLLTALDIDMSGLRGFFCRISVSKYPRYDYVQSI